MSKKTGKIKKFFEDKGYGFIENENENSRFDTFFHVNDSSAVDQYALSPGKQVSYEITEDQRGKTKAVNLEIVGE